MPVAPTQVRTITNMLCAACQCTGPQTDQDMELAQSRTYGASWHMVMAVADGDARVPGDLQVVAPGRASETSGEEDYQ
jgi:hypothetical protein